LGITWKVWVSSREAALVSFPVLGAVAASAAEAASGRREARQAGGGTRTRSFEASGNGASSTSATDTKCGVVAAWSAAAAGLVLVGRGRGATPATAWKKSQAAASLWQMMKGQLRGQALMKLPTTPREAALKTFSWIRIAATFTCLTQPELPLKKPAKASAKACSGSWPRKSKVTATGLPRAAVTSTLPSAFRKSSGHTGCFLAVPSRESDLAAGAVPLVGPRFGLISKWAKPGNPKS
jgi:hypothetical protein